MSQANIAPAAIGEVYFHVRPIIHGASTGNLQIDTAYVEKAVSQGTGIMDGLHDELPRLGKVAGAAEVLKRMAGANQAGDNKLLNGSKSELHRLALGDYLRGAIEVLEHNAVRVREALYGHEVAIAGRKAAIAIGQGMRDLRLNPPLYMLPADQRPAPV